MFIWEIQPGAPIGTITVLTIEEAAKKAQRICDAARELNPDIFTMVHGGPLAFPNDFKKLVKLTTGIHGFLQALVLRDFP